MLKCQATPGFVGHEVHEVSLVDAVVEVPVEGQVHRMGCDVTTELEPLQ